MRSLSNDDSNEDGFISETVLLTFWYILMTSISPYNLKPRGENFYGMKDINTRRRIFLFLLGYCRYEFNSWENPLHCPI